MSRWERIRALPAWVWPVALVTICFAVHLSAAMTPLLLDDAFELPRALDDSWQNWLFAYSYDAPNAQEPWWLGQLYERRVVRLLPSAMLAGELRLFGANALALHLVNVAVVAATVVLVHRLLARWTDDPPAAALATLVLAVHPASTEMAALLMDLPIAMAGLAGVTAVWFWDRMRRTGSKRAFAGSLVAAFIAVTSYEAVLFLPIGIAGADAWLFRNRRDLPGGTWMPRLAMLGVLVLYAPLVVWVRQGVMHPDSEAIRSADIVFQALRWDTEGYLAKVFVLVKPSEPFSYWLLNTVGEPLAIAILVVIVVALLYGAEDRRFRWIGLVAFAGFLGPPLIVRAAVSLMNTPTYRQIYLPIIFGLVPILAAVLARRRGRPWLFAGVAVFAIAAAVQSIRFATEFPVFQGVARLTEQARAVLAEHDHQKPLVVAGDNRCGFYPNLVWSGPVVRAFPAPKKMTDPIQITAIDDHTLEARAPGGFGRGLLDKTANWPLPPGRYNQGPMRVIRQPNFTPDRKVLAIPGGTTIELVERTAEAATVLRARLPYRLADSVLLILRGCDERPFVQPMPVPKP
ncbi:MAG TPA: glycosyltransferase family 39 protein [Kofleriaceae bacterium]